MAETDVLPSRGAQFRTSRFPGFSTPGGSYASGGDASIGTTTPQAAGSGGLLDTSGAGESLATSTLAKGAAGAAAEYAGQKIGEGAGAAIATGAGIGEAARAGFDKLGSSVSSLFDFSGSAAAAPVASSAPALSSFGGDALGNAAQEAVGAVGGQAAAPAAGAAGGAAATKLAAQSFGDRFVSGANLGGAAGAGLASFGVGLLTGQKPLQAAKSGLLSAAGFAIGNAILPGVGGFIGSTLTSFFCFGHGTPILLDDGVNTIQVQDLRIGDRLHMGGMVLGRGEVLADDLFLYRNTTVSGGHAVFENGRWIRVKDSSLAQKVDMGDKRGVVYPIMCENHILATPWFFSADAQEVDDASDLTDDQIIGVLNCDAEHNHRLIDQWRTHAAVMLEKHVKAA